MFAAHRSVHACMHACYCEFVTLWFSFSGSSITVFVEYDCSGRQASPSSVCCDGWWRAPYAWHPLFISATIQSCEPIDNNQGCVFGMLRNIAMALRVHDFEHRRKYVQVATPALRATAFRYFGHDSYPVFWLSTVVRCVLWLHVFASGAWQFPSSWSSGPVFVRLPRLL